MSEDRKEFNPELFKRLTESTRAKKAENEGKEERVRFCGERKSRDEIQKRLNSLQCDERVSDLTDNRRIEVTEKLNEMKKSANLKDGKSLYAEYREIVNDDFIEHEDFFESWWVSSKYLMELHKRKVQRDFWEEVE